MLVLFRIAQTAAKFELTAAIHHTDVTGIDMPLLREATDRDNRFCHRRMTTRGPDVSERVFQDTASRTNIPDVAHRDDVVRIVYSADEGPLDTFERQREVCHLRDQIIAFDSAEVN